MAYNKDAGYGRALLARLENIALGYGVVSAGKFFMVAPTTHPNYQHLQEVFTPDTDGTVRLFNSISAAQSAATASRNDVVFLAEGHTETITTATTLGLSKAGINYIGLGKGSLRPTITFTTAATAKIAVSAANILIRNCIFVANFADVATLFLLSTAPEFDISDCEFRDTDATHNMLAVITTTVAVVADGLKFNRNRLNIIGTTAATTPIKILGTHDRLQINDNFITKAVLNNTSCILAHGALVVTNLEMARNRLYSLNTDSSGGGLLITTSSTTNTGMVYDNYVQSLDTAAEILCTAGCVYGQFNNLHDADADKSGFVSPAIGSTA